MNFYILFKKRIANISKFLIWVLVLLFLQTEFIVAKYVKVVDGDSLEIDGRRVRLIDIDAPEYKQYCFDANGEKYYCGKISRKYLEDILKKANYDVYCDVQGIDTYKRELAECFVEGKNINLLMIRAGWAVAYRAEKKEYWDAEKKARKQKKGVWQGKFLRPEYFRRLNKR